MASLLSTTSQLSLHLSDRALTPILSSSQSPSTGSVRRQSQTQAQALSSLTTSAISAFDSASRLGLGIPQRVMIETGSGGPIILHSYLNPQSTRRPHSERITSHDSERNIIQQVRDDMRPLTATTNPDRPENFGENTDTLVNGIVNGGEVPSSEAEEVDEENNTQPPLLIGTVVAPSAADMREARRAAARLEWSGREFQRQWAREQEESQQSSISADTEVDDG